MNVDPKVVAAISSAVGLYMQAEQEVLIAQGQSSRQRESSAGHEQCLCPGRQAGGHERQVGLADALASLVLRLCPAVANF